MKKVLVIAYYFPPLGMGGTQRTAKFIKYLPDFGWQPFVLTVKDIVYFARDDSLFQEIQNAQIYRCGSFDPQRLATFLTRRRKVEKVSTGVRKSYQRLSRFLAWIFFPDTKILWLPFAFFKALKILHKQKIDCIFTTSPPHSVHLLGKTLKRLSGLPWVADFRDGWVEGNFQIEPTRLHKRINHHFEKVVVQRANAVIGVSKKLIKSLVRRYGESVQVVVIPNGFDSSDFSSVNKLPSKHKFTITYSGTISAISPLDDFIIALATFLSKNPLARSKIQVQIVGVELVGKIQSSVVKNNLQDVVKVLGYLPHHESISQIQNSHLLLYTVAEWASEDFVPGKTFEYVAAGIPVLAIAPEVEGVEILRKFADVSHANPGEIEEIVEALSMRFSNFEKGLFGKQEPSDISQLERKELTRRLADLMNKSIRK